MKIASRIISLIAIVMVLIGYYYSHKTIYQLREQLATLQSKPVDNITMQNVHVTGDQTGIGVGTDRTCHATDNPSQFVCGPDGHYWYSNRVVKPVSTPSTKKSKTKPIHMNGAVSWGKNWASYVKLDQNYHGISNTDGIDPSQTTLENYSEPIASCVTNDGVQHCKFFYSQNQQCPVPEKGKTFFCLRDNTVSHNGQPYEWLGDSGISKSKDWTGPVSTPGQTKHDWCADHLKAAEQWAEQCVN